MNPYLNKMKNEIFSKIDSNDLEYMKQFDGNINLTDYNDTTLLMMAAMSGSAEMCALLLEKGADPKLRDKDGYTALKYAVSDGRTTAVKMLLSQTPIADPDELLHIAAVENFYDTCEVLLSDPRIKVDSWNKHGRPALHFAAENGYIDTVGLLIKKGSNVNVKDSDGRSGLFHACRNRKNEMVDFLLEKGAEKLNEIPRKSGTRLTIIV